MVIRRYDPSGDVPILVDNLNLEETRVLIILSRNGGLDLSDQSTYDDRRACAGVDGINLGVQISNLLGGGFFSRESEIDIVDPDQYYGGFGIRCCQSGENGEKVLEVQKVAGCLQ
ncbi:hypothetical protein Acr_00g0005570 [Actinidia rufa]|uniref:Uncharacterized protein n=1 Tax=Actinidia rufa TaxID=165716 RepID=A0A7J0D8E3_9ERIC|nr:hypothetical protein Acr_00g0005570 [Actinidia rufa]